MERPKQGAPARLRQWRRDRKLTQIEAAKLAGTTNVQWCLWERGRVTPSLYFAFVLETATGVKAKEWFAWESMLRGMA
jgi:transcriptional regulator with XRE-family HTH domain